MNEQQFSRPCLAINSLAALRKFIHGFVVSAFLFVVGCNYSAPKKIDYFYNTEYSSEYLASVIKSNKYTIIQIHDKNSTTNYYLVGNKIFQVFTEEDELPLPNNPFFEDIFDNVTEIVLYSYRDKRNYEISDQQTINKVLVFLRDNSHTLKSTMGMWFSSDLNTAGGSGALPIYSLIFKLFFHSNRQEVMELTCHGKGFTISKMDEIFFQKNEYSRLFENNELRKYLSVLEESMKE